MGADESEAPPLPDGPPPLPEELPPMPDEHPVDQRVHPTASTSQPSTSQHSTAVQPEDSKPSVEEELLLKVTALHEPGISSALTVCAACWMGALLFLLACSQTAEAAVSPCLASMNDVVRQVHALKVGWSWCGSSFASAVPDRVMYNLRVTGVFQRNEGCGPRQ